MRGTYEIQQDLDRNLSEINGTLSSAGLAPLAQRKKGALTEALEFGQAAVQGATQGVLDVGSAAVDVARSAAGVMTGTGIPEDAFQSRAWFATPVDTGDNVAYQFARVLTPMLIGSGLLTRALNIPKIAKVLQGAPRLVQAIASPLGRELGIGAIVDFATTDDQNLSSVLRDLELPVVSSLTSILAIDDDDSALEQKIKGTLEGFALGFATDAVFKGVKALKAAKGAEKVTDVVSKADEIVETAGTTATKETAAAVAETLNKIDNTMLKEAAAVDIAAKHADPEEFSKLLKEAMLESDTKAAVNTATVIPDTPPASQFTIAGSSVTDFLKENPANIITDAAGAQAYMGRMAAAAADILKTIAPNQHPVDWLADTIREHVSTLPDAAARVVSVHKMTSGIQYKNAPAYGLTITKAAGDKLSAATEKLLKKQVASATDEEVRANLMELLSSMKDPANTGKTITGIMISTKQSDVAEALELAVIHELEHFLDSAGNLKKVVGKSGVHFRTEAAGASVGYLADLKDPAVFKKAAGNLRELETLQNVAFRHGVVTGAITPDDMTPELCSRFKELLSAVPSAEKSITGTPQKLHGISVSPVSKRHLLYSVCPLVDPTTKGLLYKALSYKPAGTALSAMGMFDLNENGIHDEDDWAKAAVLAGAVYLGGRVAGKAAMPLFKRAMAKSAAETIGILMKAKQPVNAGLVDILNEAISSGITPDEIVSSLKVKSVQELVTEPAELALKEGVYPAFESAKVLVHAPELPVVTVEELRSILETAGQDEIVVSKAVPSLKVSRKRGRAIAKLKKSYEIVETLEADDVEALRKPAFPINKKVVENLLKQEKQAKSFTADVLGETQKVSADTVQKFYDQVLTSSYSRAKWEGAMARCVDEPQMHNILTELGRTLGKNPETLEQLAAKGTTLVKTLESTRGIEGILARDLQAAPDKLAALTYIAQERIDEIVDVFQAIRGKGGVAKISLKDQKLAMQKIAELQSLAEYLRMGASGAGKALAVQKHARVIGNLIGDDIRGASAMAKLVGFAEFNTDVVQNFMDQFLAAHGDLAAVMRTTQALKLTGWQKAGHLWCEINAANMFAGRAAMKNLLGNVATTTWHLASHAISGILKGTPDKGLAVIAGLADSYGPALTLAEASFKQELPLFANIVMENKGTKNIAGLVTSASKVPVQTNNYYTHAFTAQFLGLDPKSTIGAFVDGWGRLMRTPLNVLLGTDEFFKVVNGHIAASAISFDRTVSKMAAENIPMDKFNSVYAEIAAEVTSNPDLWREDALEHTMGTALPEGSLFKLIQKSTTQHPLLKLIFPVIKQPINSLMFMMKRTVAPFTFAAEEALTAGMKSAGFQMEARVPFASLRHITDWYRNLWETDRTRAITEFAMGMGGLMLGLKLKGEGLIYGRLPTERPELREKGILPYSMKVGSAYVQYDGYDPLSNFLGFVSDYIEIMELMGDSAYIDEEGQQRIATIGIAALGHMMMDKTTMSGLSKLVELVDSPEYMMGRTAGDVIANIIPVPLIGSGKFVKTAVKSLSIEPQIATEYNGVMDYIFNYHKKALGIPQIPKRDFLGDPILEQSGAFLEDYAHIPNSDSTEDILRRFVADDQFNLKGFYRSTRKILEKRLSPQQHSRYLEIIGANLDRIMTPVVKTKQWANMSNSQWILGKYTRGGKGAYLQTAMTLAKKQARVQMEKEFPDIREYTDEVRRLRKELQSAEQDE